MRYRALTGLALLAIAMPAVRAQGPSALDRALAQPIRTVVDKPQPSPSGNPHDYVSFARYYWPDPKKPDGLPYVSHDGRHNEAQVARGDEPRLFGMENAVAALTRGWTEEHREDCARRAGEWLRAWFLAPATRMNPEMEYAQVRLGHEHNHGSQSGVLDARGFIELTGHLRELEHSPALTPAEWAQMHAWFQEYLHWLLTAKNARAEHAAPNNHGSWFLAQAIAVAVYCGKDDVARQLALEDKARIGHQILPDGRQPQELRRADALGYSAFNLDAQFDICRLARPLGIDLVHYQAPNGGSLLKALQYIAPYNEQPKKWPGSQHNPVKPGFLTPLLNQAAELQS